MIELLPWQQAHQRLCRQLIDAGLLSEAEGDGRPLLSLNCDPPSAGEVRPMLYPVWAVSATPAQKLAYRDVIEGKRPDGSDAFDWRPRRKKPRAAIAAWIRGLPAQAKASLIDEWLTDLVEADPALPRRAGQDYDGDEPA